MNNQKEQNFASHIWAMSSAIVQAKILCQKVVKYGKGNKDIDDVLINEARRIIKLIKDIIAGKYRK